MDRVLPTNSSGLQTVQALRTCGTAIAKEFVRDRVVETLFELPNLSDNTPLGLLSHGTGTAELAEINGSEICGLTLDASTESYGYLWRLPQEIDIAQAIDFSILWSNSEAAATGSATFVGVYTELVAGTTAMAIGATALDTVFTADVDLAANIVDWSPWGTIAAGSLTSTLVPGVDLLATKFSVTLTVIANATIYQAVYRAYRCLI